MPLSMGDRPSTHGVLAAGRAPGQLILAVILTYAVSPAHPSPPVLRIDPLAAIAG
ncbi:MAG: hypothetical protein VKK04_23695 [Synechococcales bacterium]|nr:hypothetical protein [Synechococcales bacterium]